MYKKLLNNVSETSTGLALEWFSLGPGTLQIFGVWDGATVKIQGSLDKLHWTDVADGSFTEDVITPFEAGQIYVRAIIYNVGASTLLNAYLVPQSTRTKYESR